MLKNFIIRILTFAIIVAIVSFLVFYLAIPQFYLPIFPFVLLFFVVTTIGVHIVVTKAGKKEIRQFSTSFMGSTTAKLFIYLIFIVIYVFTNRENAIPFIITFFILYVLFTFFETYSLLNDLKKQDKTKIEK